MTIKPVERYGARRVLIFLAVVIAVLLFASAASAAPDYVAGDVNGDGKIDVRDVVMVQKHILGLQFPPLTAVQLLAADVNNDGDINISDAVEIMKIALGIIDSYPMPIISLNDAVVRVPIGTALADINHPSTVEANFAGGLKRNIGVRWERVSTPAYNPMVFGEYLFKGSLINLPSGVRNPAGLTAIARVSFLLRDPWPFPGPAPTPYSLTLRSNPEQGGMVYGDGNYSEGAQILVRAVPNAGYTFDNWTRQGTEVSRFATFFYTMPAANTTLVANFSPSRVITGVDALPALTVPVGTAIGNVPLPASVRVYYQDGTTSNEMNMAVTWDNGTPVYNGNNPGLYVFSGTIMPPLGSNITNPQNRKATLAVIVTSEPLEIVSVYPLSSVTVALGTPFGSIPFPSTVMVELSNGFDVLLGVINWQTAPGVIYNPSLPGTYSCGGDLVLPTNITNPLNLMAEADVIVTSTIALTGIGPIQGDPRVGNALLAGTLSPAGATATYQWTISDTVGGSYSIIFGATSTTYTPVAANVGKYLKVVATGTGNYSGTITSVAAGPVLAVTPLTGIGPIQGDPRVGNALLVGALSPAGATATYQWTISDTLGGIYSNIPGATSTTYTPIAANVGKYLKVVATGTGGYSGSATSAAKGPVLAAHVWPIEMEGEPLIVQNVFGDYEVTITIKNIYKDQVTAVTILGESAVQLPAPNDHRWRFIFPNQVTINDLVNNIVIDLTPSVVDMTQTRAELFLNIVTVVRVYLKPGETALSVVADGNNLTYNGTFWQSELLLGYTVGDPITVTVTTADITQVEVLTVQLAQ